MEQGSKAAIILAVLTIILQVIAWALPDAHPFIIIFMLFMSIFLTIFIQSGTYKSTFQQLRSIGAFFIENTPLFISSISLVTFIAIMSFIENQKIAFPAQLIASAILGATVSNIINLWISNPKVRIAKGSSDAVYLVENRTKRHIPDNKTLIFISLDTYRPLERISDAEMRFYSDGPPIPSISSCELVKGSGKSVYVIWEGKRKHIPDEETLYFFFPGRKWKEIDDQVLEDIPRDSSLRSILTTGIPFVMKPKE